MEKLLLSHKLTLKNTLPNSTLLFLNLGTFESMSPGGMNLKTVGLSDFSLCFLELFLNS